MLYQENQKDGILILSTEDVHAVRIASVIPDAIPVYGTGGGGGRIKASLTPNYVADGMNATTRCIDLMASITSSIVWVSCSPVPEHVVRAAEHHNCSVFHVNVGKDDIIDLDQLIESGLLETLPTPLWEGGELGPISPSLSWMRELRHRISSTFWASVSSFLRNQIESVVVVPLPSMRLRVLRFAPPCCTRVVIIGREPDARAEVGGADGLAFSSTTSKMLQDTQAIIKELERDPAVGKKPAAASRHEGDLVAAQWPQQGVLLLNGLLTAAVEGGRGSHARVAGWEGFTDACVAAVSDESPFCVFLLWGESAHAKSKFINSKKHVILRAGYPTTRNDGMGFACCGHFGIVNRELRSHGLAEIEW